MQRLIHKEIKNIFVFPSKNKAVKESAKFIANLISKNPQASISYATGNTQIPVYLELARMVLKSKLDFSKTKAFHLDEYYPCKPSAQHSFVGYLRKCVFNPLRISQSNVFELNGKAVDPKKEAKRYEGLLKKHPVTLTILGIGPGGHIGFNEPGSSFKSNTRLIKLSKETLDRDRNDRGQKSPDHALTQGIATILKSKVIILNAFDQEHGKYLKHALTGRISNSCPASALRLVGSKVVLFLSSDAAKEIRS